MATEVIIPALGVVVDKVKIVNWFKSEGDRVEKGEPLLEIESDKVVTEIPAPASGILRSILYEAGSEVGITKVVAVITEEGEAEVPPRTSAKPETVKVPKAVPSAKKLAEEKGVDLALVTPTGPHGTIMKKDVEAYLAPRGPEEPKEPKKVSGVAKKVAAELGVSLDTVEGTGPGGRVMKSDVLKAAKPSTPRLAEEGKPEEVIPMSKMRQVIAKRLSQSAFTAPHIYLFAEVDVDKLLDLRESIVEEFERRFKVRISINDFLIKAVALSIREYPYFNACLKGEAIHIRPNINVGLAVALDEGLIVPAVVNADKRSLGEIARERIDLVDRAKQGRLTMEEIERGTFTISSLSGFDVTFFTAIINPPQTGILSVGKVREHLFLEQGQVKVKRVMSLGLSADHRVIDGAVAARFLQAVKRRLECPVLCLLEN